MDDALLLEQAAYYRLAEGLGSLGWDASVGETTWAFVLGEASRR